MYNALKNRAAQTAQASLAQELQVKLKEKLDMFRVLKGRTMTLKPRSSPIRAVEFSPDGATGASANTDVDLWERVSGKLIIEFSGQAGNVSSLAFAPKGNAIASGSGWPIVTGKNH
jgi:WD40 repeat protein